jgi:hypothetical protein
MLNIKDTKFNKLGFSFSIAAIALNILGLDSLANISIFAAFISMAFNIKFKK